MEMERPSNETPANGEPVYERQRAHSSYGSAQCGLLIDLWLNLNAIKIMTV